MNINNKNRGMLLETIINKTISHYQEHDIAIFHKKHVPIVFNKVTSIGNRPAIDKGYISAKSQVDYYGIYKGRFIAFEAKSCNGKYLPLANIKEHQQQYLLDIERHGGMGFYIVLFKDFNKFVLLKPDFVNKTKNKGLTLDESLELGTEIPLNYPGIIDFISYLV